MFYMWHLFFMALLYFVLGIFHFIKPKMYLKLIPPYLPNPKILNYLAGFFEMLFGILLLHSFTRNFAVVGIILMLFAFLPTHIYMLTNKRAGMNLPKSVLIIRIFLQFFLMFWAFQYYNVSL